MMYALMQEFSCTMCWFFGGLVCQRGIDDFKVRGHCKERPDMSRKLA